MRVPLTLLILNILMSVSLTGCASQVSGKVKGCSVVVAYISEKGGAYSIDLYSVATGIEKSKSLRGIKSIGSIAGYDQESDSWIFMGGDVYHPYALWRMSNGRKVNVATTPYGEIMGVDKWISPSVVKGKLAVSFYSKHGKLIHTRYATLRDGPVSEVATSGYSPENGYVAVELLLKNRSRSQLYVFDSRLKLKRRVGAGVGPGFVRHGQLLNYQDNWSVRREEGELLPSYDGSANEVILDLNSGVKRVIDVVQEPDPLRGIPDCALTEDGNWLVCTYSRYPGYERAVYVVDIRKPKPVWHRLPIMVPDGQWILLNKMPRKF